MIKSNREKHLDPLDLVQTMGLVLSLLTLGRLRTRARARAHHKRLRRLRSPWEKDKPRWYYSWERFPPLGSGRFDFDFTCAHCKGTEWGCESERVWDRTVKLLTDPSGLKLEFDRGHARYIPLSIVAALVVVTSVSRQCSVAHRSDTLVCPAET